MPLTSHDIVGYARSDSAWGAATVSGRGRRQWRPSTWTLLSLLTILPVLVAGGLLVDIDGSLVQGMVLGLGLIVSVVLARHIIRTTAVQKPAQVRREVAERAVRYESFRRVAMLAASGAPTAEVLSAIAEEAGPVAGAAERAQVYRYGPAGSLVQLVAGADDPEELQNAAGPSASTRAVSAAVFKTGQLARLPATEPHARGDGPRLRAVVGAPILVDGSVWGLIVVTVSGPEPLTDDFETRIAVYAELAAAAVSSTQARAALAASRIRVVAAADEARRTIERNLHDGTQQRLVTLAFELRQAADMSLEPSQFGDLLSRMTAELVNVLEELREISHGVHPAVLSQAGLRPALRSLARRAAVPVTLSVEVPGRLPEPVEVAAYYVVCEALANTAKHSGARAAEVGVRVLDGALVVRVLDDGAGGADEARGSGIVGLRDRVEALGGTMAVASPVGGGTAIRVELPVAALRETAATLAA